MGGGREGATVACSHGWGGGGGVFSPKESVLFAAVAPLAAPAAVLGATARLLRLTDRSLAAWGNVTEDPKNEEEET